MTRRLAAILAADVVGYSRLMADDEAGTLAALKEHRRNLFDPETARNNGRIVKLIGDGTLVEFPSVVDAVKCAVAIQKALAEAGSPISVRIGINLGDIIVDGDDIYGDGVNIAARLEALADPGTICVSSIVHESLGNRIDIDFTDLGEHEVKNIDKPIRVFRWQATDRPHSSVPKPMLELPDKPSIAVLPFDNMSGDPDQEYFADGIAEDIITALSRIRWFFVSARNSSFTYKGRAVDIKQVARELGVQYVLEGSVRKAGNRVRITVQLIDAMNGNHLWADRFDRELNDIFVVQDEITETVVATIEPQLYVAESNRANRKSPENLDAWDFVMRAMPNLWRMTGADNVTAQELLQAAIERDPNCAHAYGPLGFSLIWHSWMGWGDNPTSLIPRAESAARKAISLDDQDPWAHLVMACVHAYGRRHEDAVGEIRIALDLNPNFSLAYTWLAVVMGYAGKLDESLEALDRTFRISPRDPFNACLPVIRAIAFFTAERDVEARELAYETIKLRPNMVGAWRIVTITSAHLGEMDEARRGLSETKRLQPTISLKWAREFGPWVRKKDLDRYIEGFRLAGLE